MPDHNRKRLTCLVLRQRPKFALNFFFPFAHAVTETINKVLLLAKARWFLWYGLTFSLSSTKMEIYHIPKRPIFCDKININQQEKNVSTSTSPQNTSIMICTGGFWNGDLFGHFCSKNTVFRHNGGHNAYARFRLRSTVTQKTKWCMP